MKVNKRKRIIVQEYNVYITKDGKEFTSEEECINHEKFSDGTKIICPVCNGKRGKYVKWVEPPDNYIKRPKQIFYDWYKCKRCSGKGYLEKKIIWE